MTDRQIDRQPNQLTDRPTNQQTDKREVHSEVKFPEIFHLKYVDIL